MESNEVSYQLKPVSERTERFGSRAAYAAQTTLTFSVAFPDGREATVVFVALEHQRNLRVTATREEDAAFGTRASTTDRQMTLRLLNPDGGVSRETTFRYASSDGPESQLRDAIRQLFLAELDSLRK